MPINWFIFIPQLMIFFYSFNRDGCERVRKCPVNLKHNLNILYTIQSKTTDVLFYVLCHNFRVFDIAVYTSRKKINIWFLLRVLTIKSIKRYTVLRKRRKIIKNDNYLLTIDLGISKCQNENIKFITIRIVEGIHY